LRHHLCKAGWIGGCWLVGWLAACDCRLAGRLARKFWITWLYGISFYQHAPFEFLFVFAE